MLVSPVAPIAVFEVYQKQVYVVVVQILVYAAMLRKWESLVRQGNVQSSVSRHWESGDIHPQIPHRLYYCCPTTSRA